MHFVLLHRVADSDIQQGFLQFRGEEQVWLDTSIILYPRKHGHYNQDHSTPLVREIMPFLLLKKNRDDKAYNEHPAGFADHLQLLYHSSIIRPMLYDENLEAFLFLPILQIL